MLSIIGTWMFLMIIALCFKNYRAHLKSFGRGFVCECYSLCKETCGKEATCLAYLLILFIALIFLLCSLILLPENVRNSGFIENSISLLFSFAQSAPSVLH